MKYKTYFDCNQITYLYMYIKPKKKLQINVHFFPALKQAIRYFRSRHKHINLTSSDPRFFFIRARAQRVQKHKPD